MAKVKGLNIYLKVNTGTVGSPTWTKVGGQKEATFERGQATIETTDKDSSGNEEHLTSTRNWSFSFDAFLIEDNAGFLEVETAYDDGTLKQFQFVTPGFTYMGTASVESLSISGALGDASVASFSLKGSGALTKTAV
ncbi:hypothetical protein KA005_34105 [bacterium]|nr:hypothetical protein [bacterium]